MCAYLGSRLQKDFSLYWQGGHSQVHGSRSYVGVVKPPPSCPPGSREHRLEAKAGITFKKPTPSGLLLPARLHPLSSPQHSKAVKHEPVKNIPDSNSSTRPVTGKGFETAIQVNLWQMTRVVPETGPQPWERRRAWVRLAKGKGSQENGCCMWGNKQAGFCWNFMFIAFSHQCF